MKRLALAFLLVLASYSVSSAQQVGAPVIVYSPLSGTSQPQFPVTSTNPFPVVCESGCSGGGSSGAVFGPTAAGSPAANPPVLIGGTIDGTGTGNVDNWKVVSGVGFVNCANCSGSGVSQTDEATFTAGTSLFAPGGGFYQTTATSNPLTTGQQGLWQMTANRAGFVNLRNASGTEIGTAAAPVQISLANTGANATALLTTGTGGTFPVTGTFWQATQPVSAASLPLPTGAATAALQGTNTGTTAHTCSIAGFSILGCLGQLDDDVKGGIAAGANVIGFTSNDACSQATKLGAPINLTASGQLITGTSAKKTYICSLDLISATAQNIALVEGTGSTCATNIYGLAGGTTAATGWNLPANGGLTKGSGAGTVYSPSGDTNATAANVCLLSSSTGQISGQITYVQQ